MTRLIRITVLMTSLLATLVACVSAPTGPTIAVMPREGKPFEVFQQEDQQCGIDHHGGDALGMHARPGAHGEVDRQQEHCDQPGTALATSQAAGDEPQ